LTGDDVRALLVERWGADVAPDGAVDRAAIARIVFDRPEEREWLQGVVWPRVGERMVDWRARLDELDPAPPAAVVEVPLLFEAGMEDGFDTTIAVVAEEAVREERAGGRGHRGVESRTSRQLSQEEKAARADVVVHNDGSIEDLERELSSVLDTIRA
jgi:dephospho-CoA kinase